MPLLARERCCLLYCALTQLQWLPSLPVNTVALQSCLKLLLYSSWSKAPDRWDAATSVADCPLLPSGPESKCIRAVHRPIEIEKRYTSRGVWQRPTWLCKTAKIFKRAVILKCALHSTNGKNRSDREYSLEPISRKVDNTVYCRRFLHYVSFVVWQNKTYALINGKHYSWWTLAEGTKRYRSA